MPLQKNSLRGKSRCRKIALVGKVQIPPLSEMDIASHMILPNLHSRNEEKQWATQPQLLASGLLVAGTLLPDRTMDLMVRVPNAVQCQMEEVSVVEESVPSEPSSVCSSVKETPALDPSEPAEYVLATLWEGVADDVPADVRDRLRTPLKNTEALSRRPQRVDMVRSAARGRTSKDCPPLDWNMETIGKEQSEDPALGWILNKNCEYETGPTYDEVRPLCEEVKSLVAQWPHLRMVDSVLYRDWLGRTVEQVLWHQLIPLPERRSILIQLAHKAGGHLRIRRSLAQEQLSPTVMSAYRATEHDSTGFTPCKLFLGREVTLPIDLVLGECLPACSNPLNVMHFVTDQERIIKTAFADVREFSQRLATVRASRYNLWVSPAAFKPEDWESKEVGPEDNLEFVNLDGLGEEDPDWDGRDEVPQPRPRREIKLPGRYRD